MRRAARCDNNQTKIVEKLRGIPCVSVAVNHHDILVGFKGKTYWYEVKNPDTLNREGIVRETCKKKSQKKLQAEWKGHYKIVTCIEEILADVGIL